MALTSELIKSFVEVTKDKTDVKNESTILGTVITKGDTNYVKLDGSDLLTPVNSTSVLKNGERVMVLIKDHTATVTGNVTTPSARNDDVETVNGKVEEVKAEVGEFNTLLADKATIKDLEAEIARINYLTADNVFIKDQLTADKAAIEELVATDVEITGKLTATEAEIGILETTKLDAAIADIKFATIESLEATDIKVNNLEANYGDFKDLTTDKFTAIDASIKNLESEDVKINGLLEANKAEIEDLSAITIKTGSLEAYKGIIENLFSSTANIDELKSKYIEALKIETDAAKIQQLEAALAKIGTLEATLANVEKLVSSTIITDDLEASKADIDYLSSTLANIGTAIIDIAKIENLEAVNAEIENLNTQYLNVIQANVDVLNAKSATIEQLTTYVLQSEFGNFKKLTVDDLDVNKANIGKLDALVGNINSIMSGSIGTGTLQAIHLTADNVVIDDAIIKSAMIDTIDTSIVNITSSDGGLKIIGNTQQWYDKEGNIRMQAGHDANGEFTFAVYGKDGKTAVFSENGITEYAVPDGLVVDKMISDNASIQAKKIRYVDKEGNTTLQTHLEVEQGRINALIKETTIENDDGTTTSLKDKYLDINANVDGIKTSIGDIQFDEGESIASKLVDIEVNADGISKTVTQQGTDIQNAMAKASQLSDKFSWIVKSGTDETNFELTDRTASLIAYDINMNGRITFGAFNKDTQDKLLSSGGTQLLKGTNNSKTLSENNNWKDGTWGQFGGADGSITSAIITDCPNKNINYGWVFDTTSNDDISFVCQSEVPTTIGVRYTMSCWVKVETVPTTIVLSYGGNNKTVTNVIELNTTGWQRVNYTFEPTSETSNDNVSNIYYGIDKGCIATICGMKLEIGDKASDWSMYYGEVASQELLDAWTGDDVVEGVTTINGEYIKTGTIDVRQLNVDSIFVPGTSVMNIIKAQSINADFIDAGHVSSEHIDLYGLTVKNKLTEVETLHISDEGDVTLRGSIESYNYVEGKTGWSIRENGDSYFNDVIMRGSLITNDGGIVTSGGSGENLQLNSNFSNGFNNWVEDGNATCEISSTFQYNGINCISMSRLQYPEVLNSHFYSGNNAIPCKEGESFVAQAMFFSRSLHTIDNPIKLSIYFYDVEGTTLSRTSVDVEFVHETWVYHEVIAEAPQNASYVALVITMTQNGMFFFACPKIERGTVSTPYSLSPKDKFKQVRFWAGATYDEKDNAPWIVYNDGSMKATKGEFIGVVTGQVEIGNISIIDPNKTAGGDALLTIINGGNGIKAVQLMDTDHSDFAQDIVITDNFYNEQIRLNQDGVGTFKTSVEVGDKVLLEGKSLKIDGFELTTGSTGYIFKTPQVNIGSSSQDSYFRVYGKSRFSDEIRVERTINYDGVLECTVSSLGLDFNFIN